jgi:2-aminoadipate transaminase
VLVETPTYLGALQAFAPLEPQIVSVASDAGGVDVDALLQQLGAGDDQPESMERRRLLTLDLDPASSPAAAPRFLYVLPNFQNPTGRSMGLARRQLRWWTRPPRRGSAARWKTTPTATSGSTSRRPRH